MTPDQCDRLEEQLRAASESYGNLFERWYETASLPDIKYFCRTGWLLEKFVYPEEKS
jgi:hypothetical protein